MAFVFFLVIWSCGLQAILDNKSLSLSLSVCLSLSPSLPWPLFCPIVLWLSLLSFADLGPEIHLPRVTLYLSLAVLLGSHRSNHQGSGCLPSAQMCLFSNSFGYAVSYKPCFQVSEQFSVSFRKQVSPGLVLVFSPDPRFLSLTDTGDWHSPVIHWHSPGTKCHSSSVGPQTPLQQPQLHSYSLLCILVAFLMRGDIYLIFDTVVFWFLIFIWLCVFQFSLYLSYLKLLCI